MALTTMALWQDDVLTFFPEKPRASGRIVLALPGDFFVRRHFPKPFDEKRKIAAIISGIFSDTAPEKDDYHTTFTMAAPQDNHFTVIAAAKPQLATHIAAIKEKTDNVVVGAVPIALGFTALVAKSGHHIAVAETPWGTIAAAAIKDGNLVDFREMSAARWKTENTLTIRTWLNLLTDPTLHSSNDSYMPTFARKQFEHLEADGLQRGLHTICQDHWQPDLQLIARDNSIQNTLKSLTVTAATWAKYMWVSCTVISLALFGFGIAYQQQATTLDNQTTALFSQTLPGVPLIDAPLQLRQELNKRELAAGKNVSRSGKTPNELMAHLAQEFVDYDLAVTFSNLIIKPAQITMSGRISSLSELDRLQTILGDFNNGYQVNLKRTDIQAGGIVSFTVEAEK